MNIAFEKDQGKINLYLAYEVWKFGVHYSVHCTVGNEENILINKSITYMNDLWNTENELLSLFGVQCTALNKELLLIYKSISHMNT